jgi:hypothetical protein
VLSYRGDSQADPSTADASPTAGVTVQLSITWDRPGLYVVVLHVQPANSQHTTDSAVAPFAGHGRFA